MSMLRAHAIGMSVHFISREIAHKHDEKFRSHTKIVFHAGFRPTTAQQQAKQYQQHATNGREPENTAGVGRGAKKKRAGKRSKTWRRRARQVKSAIVEGKSLKQLILRCLFALQARHHHLALVLVSEVAQQQWVRRAREARRDWMRRTEYNMRRNSRETD